MNINPNVTPASVTNIKTDAQEKKDEVKNKTGVLGKFSVGQIKKTPEGNPTIKNISDKNNLSGGSLTDRTINSQS